jgi:hypothetical protein
VRDYPRLQGRADRLRADYDKLQKVLVDLAETENGDAADVLRERLGKVLMKLRNVQAQETELIFEAFHVDIGAGD